MRPPRSRRSALLAAVVANLVPLVGIVFWEWSFAVLVLLYWIELGVLILFASIRALFAQRPAEFPEQQLIYGAFHDKYGGLSLPKTDLEIQLQSLVVLIAVPVLGLLWLFIGGFVLLGVNESATGGLARAEAPTLTVGIVGLLSSHLFSTGEYVLDREYEDVNAQMVVQSAFWPLAVTGLAMVLGAGLVTASESTVVLLVGIAGTKFLLDLVGVYRDRLRAFDESQSLDLGWAYDPPEKPSVDESFAEPFEVVRPTRRAVLASGGVRGLHALPGLAFFALFSAATAFFLAFGATEVGLVTGAMAGLLLCLMVAVGVVDHAIRYLSMEYRIGGSTTDSKYVDIVGYDRLLDEPSWRIRGEERPDTDVERGRVDRFFGTETVVVESDDRTVRLAHIPDATVVTEDWGRASSASTR